MDLEGHELEVLKGAVSLLRSTEAVLAESAFFGDETLSNSPLHLTTFLEAYDFALFDILAIGGRPSDARAVRPPFVKNTSALSLDQTLETERSP